MAQPNTISSRQAAVVNDGGFLDLLAAGSNYGEAETMTFDSVVDTLLYLAALYQSTAIDKLNALDKVASGALGDSISVSDVKIMGTSYVVEISIADYYKFVDQGVNGWNQAQGSPFSFKQYTGKAGTKASPMITAIQAWIKQQGLQGNVSGIKKTISSREKKQRTITDATLSTAIAISKSVRKKGIKATNFWTDTETEVANQAEQLLGIAVKADIVNSLYGNGNQ